MYFLKNFTFKNCSAEQCYPRGALRGTRRKIPNITLRETIREILSGNFKLHSAIFSAVYFAT